MKGLSGWLALDGQFYPCRYGEHHQLAELIYDAHEREMNRLREKLSKERKGYVDRESVIQSGGFIKLGCDSFGSGYIFFPVSEPMTKEQAWWFYYNQDKLSKEQREMWEWYCDQNSIETEEMAS
ncbi:hypothetical protein [Lihuaxuella thermophila]|uniref:Uncharacterized protein n=1 Tax=Lihuaxuella thermophila TaxID=1173111 RepID=A0A1H8HB87_9BACL|nr:hypothetical protein [Lihuaxuella thermophila]SEN53472.1 hypothetical protein SAMN05444955_113128 [Lihuaxuella thermophila]SEN78124.1 hypothetical protein SAMN05444955_12331 [Lihuaxuella thermophila]SEN80458.1 hypothetical protein SAMN05444955_12611 [Lihuaxuella thermophila]